MKILIFILSCFFITCLANDKTIFTMIHFRHGARAPVMNENSDNFGEQWDNPGELTGIGERMHYLLGYRNRMRYIKEKKLLSENFNIDELLIISTKVNRTIMSLLSHLQGLYPQKKNLGYFLNENQLNNSNPPINLNYTEIQEKITELKNYSLPDSMTVIPFEIRYSTRSYYLYMDNGCIGESKLFNSSLTNNTSSVVDEFNEKYAKIIDEFHGKKAHNYSLYELSSICDTLIATYTEGKNMTEFKKTGINVEELNTFCIKAIKYLFSDYLIRGDKMIFLEGSIVMDLLINYAKMSIDADINNSNSSSSNPKILIFSGHDTTVTKQQLFLFQALGLDINTYYRFPTYASQIAFEVSRKDDDKKNRNYSDYFVNYYFNDEHILNISADEFINKIEPNIWSEEKINTFCGYNSDNNSNNSSNTNNSAENNNSTDGNNNNNNIENNNNSYIYFPRKKQKTYKAPFIVFVSLFGVSLIGNLILIALLLRKNTAPHIRMDSTVMKNLK